MSASGSCNLYLNHNEYDTAPITVTGELADTARIGVTMVESQRPTDTNPSVSIAKAMTAGWIKDGNFVSDYNFYQMGVATLPNGQLAQLRLHDHTWGVRVKSATGSKHSGAVLHGIHKLPEHRRHPDTDSRRCDLQRHRLRRCKVF